MMVITTLESIKVKQTRDSLITKKFKMVFLQLINMKLQKRWNQTKTVQMKSVKEVIAFQKIVLIKTL